MNYLHPFSKYEIINENIQKARAVLRQAGLNQNDPRFVRLRALLSNNLGYIGKFTEWMVLNKVSYEQLESLFNRIKDRRLSKPIDQFNTPEEVIDEIIRKKSDSDIHQMLNAIPSKTREFIQECDDFNNLENFLIQHADKKDLIIDFFSKKGGRYGDEDEYEVIENIIDDLEKVIDSKSISDISKLSKNSNDIKFVLEDDDMLIVAVNYEGIQEVGSGYWCITEDEYTFQDYVMDAGLNIQLVIYFKNKIPFVDDMSVLGVTWNIAGESIHAAHWEDDEPFSEGRRKSDKVVSNKIKGIGGDKLFEIAESLYDIEASDYIWECKPLYSKLILNNIGDISKLTSTLSNFIDYASDSGNHVQDFGFYKDFIKSLKSNGITLKVSDNDLFRFSLHSISKYTYQDINVESAMWDAIEYGENVTETLKWLSANKYNFKKYFSTDGLVFLLGCGLMDAKDILEKYSIERILNDVDDSTSIEKIVDYFFENSNHELISGIILDDEEHSDFLMDVLTKNYNSKNKLIAIRDILNSNFYFNREHLIRLLECSDDDIKSMVAHKLIPREITDHFDITITPKSDSKKIVKNAKKLAK